MEYKELEKLVISVQKQIDQIKVLDIQEWFLSLSQQQKSKMIRFGEMRPSEFSVSTKEGTVVSLDLNPNDLENPEVDECLDRVDLFNDSLSNLTEGISEISELENLIPISNPPLTLSRLNKVLTLKKPLFKIEKKPIAKNNLVKPIAKKNLVFCLNCEKENYAEEGILCKHCGKDIFG